MSRTTRILISVIVGLILLPASWLVTGVRAQDEQPEEPPTEVAANVDVDFERTISVTGEGRVLITPDVAQTTLGVQVEAEELSQALDEANQRMSDVINALTQLGIPEDQIETTTFTIDVARDREEETQAITGYTVTNLVQITVPEIERVGEVIEAATSAGANRVSGVQFTVEDTDQAIREAREEAMRDARSTAEHLANIAGVALGQPVSINESSVPPPRPFEQFGEAAVTEQAPPIAPGQQEIVVTVTVSYAMEPDTTGQ